jgi:DNA invertase Pin-like site-specific DNA recombinase
MGFAMLNPSYGLLPERQKREAIRRHRDDEPVREIAGSYNVSHSTFSRLIA